jgi:hypothetical protein
VALAIFGRFDLGDPENAPKALQKQNDISPDNKKLESGLFRQAP